MYWNTCGDVTESPNFPTVESMAVWVMGRWDHDCRKKGELQDPWLFSEPVRRYADALAFTARCILRWQSEEILEKLSENIDIWPEIVSSDDTRALNEQKLLPFLEKRKRRTTALK